MEINKATVLITGGASGLGLACAQRFAHLGANIFIADLNDEAGQSVSAESNGKITYTNVDVSSEEQVLKWIQTAEKKTGRLNILINCAGIAIATKVLNKENEAHSLNAFLKVLTINLAGTFNTSRLFAQAIRKHPSHGENLDNGVIINTASVAAFDGQIGQAAYTASKAGVAGMTLPLAREFASYGIRVCTIAPGIFETPMLASLPEKARLSLGQQVPFPSRLGKPDEYAALAQHIVENQFLNGETIRLDGAIRMSAK